uniref:Uncharacterized protein n=1 Tax=Setaria italica TaxID=4555 RepID=K3ZP75_SETIT
MSIMEPWRMLASFTGSSGEEEADHGHRDDDEDDLAGRRRKLGCHRFGLSS